MSRFFLTTAIYYPNAVPHLGTAYEILGTDVVARWRRLRGDDVFFLSGNDDHAQKVAQRAREQGKEPEAYCDEMAAAFEAAWKALGVEYDEYVRYARGEPVYDGALTFRDKLDELFSSSTYLLATPDMKAVLIKQVREGADAAGADPALHPGLLPGLPRGGLVRLQALHGPALGYDPATGLTGGDEKDLHGAVGREAPGQGRELVEPGRLARRCPAAP